MTAKKTTIDELAFHNRFATEAEAVAYYESVRWPYGRICPSCKNSKTYPHKAKDFCYRCPTCRKDFTCKSHTIMHASPLPVKKWLYAMFKLSSACDGISTQQLANQLQITHKSARNMITRIEQLGAASELK